MMTFANPPCHVVYDAASSLPDGFWLPGLALGLAAFALVMWRHPHSFWGPRKRVRLTAAFIAVFAVLWALLVGGVIIGGGMSTSQALQHGRYQRVEGTVTNFVPGPAGGHGEEHWEVASGGRVFRYSYSDYVISPGYRRTASHGGVIREGLHVRIADVDGNIARLEVCR